MYEHFITLLFLLHSIVLLYGIVSNVVMEKINQSIESMSLIWFINVGRSMSDLEKVLPCTW